MIVIFIGTRAQLIKMAPVVLELEALQLPLTLVFTGQHKETMQELLIEFGLKTPVQYLYDGAEITGIAQMAKWFVVCFWKCIRHADKYLPRSPSTQNIMVVHGDTFSTLLGAVVGKMLRFKVVHVEAGLRSYNLFHPFPEEITRIITFRLSDVAFCPGKWAYKNMEKYKLLRINMGHNTLLDSVYCAAKYLKNQKQSQSVEGPYGVCSIHRFENIFDKKRLKIIIELILIAAKKYKLVFVLHPATKNNLQKFDLMKELELNQNILLTPRMTYLKFIQLLLGAKFVITDGGGNQEELSYLGIPTCLMRKATERQEGLNSTATLCGYSSKELKGFLEKVELSGKNIKQIQSVDKSPSSIIAAFLQELIAGNQPDLVSK